MQITDVAVTLFPRELPVTPRWAPTGGLSTMGVLRIETDDGVSGSTFLPSRQAHELMPAFLGTFKPLLMGRNPLAREAIWQDLWNRRQVAWPLVGAIDVALWDLAGRAAGRPIHQLIGTFTEKLPAYCGNSGLPPKPEAYVEDVQRQQARGFRGYKIHANRSAQFGGGGVERDIAICTAVRKAAGDGFPLMYDLHAVHSYGDAIKLGLVLQELNFLWYEDVLPEDDIYGYTRLKQHLHIPLLATETAPRGPYGHNEWLVNKATDMLRGDVIGKGGITPLLKLAHLAEMFRLQFEPHHFAHSTTNIATLNVMLAIPNAGMFEVNLPDDFFKYGMITDVDVDAQGFVQAPSGPGLGHEIDWDLIRRTQTAVVR